MRSLKLGLLALALLAPGLRAQARDSIAQQVRESERAFAATMAARDPTGKIVGTFSSVWRREADGRWRVLFDKGCDVCNCAPAP